MGLATRPSRGDGVLPGAGSVQGVMGDPEASWPHRAWHALFLLASSTSVLPLPTTGPRGDSPRHCDSRCFLGHRVSASRALPAPSCDTACFPLLASLRTLPLQCLNAGSLPGASVQLPPAGRRAPNT